VNKWLKGKVQFRHVPYVYCTHVSIVSVHSNTTYLLAYMKAIVSPLSTRAYSHVPY